MITNDLIKYTYSKYVFQNCGCVFIIIWVCAVIQWNYFFILAVFFLIWVIWDLFGPETISKDLGGFVSPGHYAQYAQVNPSLLASIVIRFSLLPYFPPHSCLFQFISCLNHCYSRIISNYCQIFKYYLSGHRILRKTSDGP